MFYFITPYSLQFFFFLNLWNIQVEGMQRPCRGSLDKTPPKEILWGTYAHRLFFGRESSSSWGPGGVAFLNPERKIQDKAYLCLYRITCDICDVALLISFVSPFYLLLNIFPIRTWNF